LTPDRDEPLALVEPGQSARRLAKRLPGRVRVRLLGSLDQLGAALLEGAPDGVVVSSRGVILFANALAAQMLGYESPASLEGVLLPTLLDPDDGAEMLRRTQLMLQTGARFPARVYRANRKGGGKISAEITSVPFEWQGQSAVLAFARDVSERTRLHAQLAMTDRLAALGTLAAGVAHEINNPMTTVLLGLEALQRAVDRQPPPRPELTGLISDLQQSAMRVVEIVRDLRRFSHAGEEARKPVSLPDVLRAAERLVTHALAPNVTLSSDCAEVAPVLAVAARVEQVAVNLILNAAQAIPDGRPGSVRVRTLVAGDGRIGFEVTDDGSGIASEHLPHIFEPFFTTKPVGVGTGLGLAISHTLVTELGGELVVESVLGQGATFRVLFPAPK
jgi:PAS domain S-box-containing protein